MKLFCLVTFSSLFFGCSNSDNTINTKHTSIWAESEIRYFNLLDKYLSFHKIEPLITVSNTEHSQTEIEISKHSIHWFNTEDETMIRINNDLFSLKDKFTLNNVRDTSREIVDFANNWKSIKLFSLNGRELIGISMHYYICTGIGCNIEYYLLYDVTTKTKSFFGFYRGTGELNIYQFRNDSKFSFVSQTYIDTSYASQAIEFNYGLYSLEDNGLFKLQRNRNGQPYTLKRTFYPNDTTKSMTFEQNWFEELN
jgi:hypothetical protein